MKAVFFDLYQTLVRYDPPREETIAKTLEKFGIQVDPAVFTLPIVAADEYIYQAMAQKALGSRSPEEKLAIYTRHQEILYEKAGVDIDPRLIPEVLARMQAYKYDLVLFDDVNPVLEELRRRGIYLGLISNVDFDMTHTFDDLELSTSMDVIVTSRDAGVTKPDPAIFQQVLAQSGVAAADALYVGDQYEVDVAGARAAGMNPVLIDRPGYHTKEMDCPKIAALPELYALL